MKVWFASREMLSAAVVWTIGATQAWAVEDSKIRSLIEAADVVPASYRRHINISQSGDTVMISVHRDPDAQPNDCRIDAIVIAEKVLEAGSPARLVKVAFYDLSDNDKYWQVDVPTSAVTNFANGQIGKEAVLRATTLTPVRSNPLAKSYGHLSYVDIIKELGVIDGAGRDERALALVRLTSLQRRGVDTTELKRQFIHIEDLARRGNEVGMKSALTKLNSEISQKTPAKEEYSLQLKDQDRATEK